MITRYKRPIINIPEKTAECWAYDLILKINIIGKMMILNFKSNHCQKDDLKSVFFIFKIKIMPNSEDGSN